jgi:uncharacterized membrane protein
VEPPHRGQLERWVNFGATIVAPATVLSAVLFYFGYVSARAQYEYFGVDVDTIGLSTRDYVMRSPQPLLVPLLVLTLVGVVVVVLHTAIRERIVRATAAGDESASRVAGLRRLTGRAMSVGLVVLSAGIVLLFSYPVIREWALYNLVTPLLIALGAAIVAYSSHVLGLLAASGSSAVPPRTSATVRNAPSTILVRRSAVLLIVVVVAACTFWATATIAQWSGRGLAHYNARHLDRYPSVILDTKERLYLTNGCRRTSDRAVPCVDESMLPATAGQEYKYRYRHLRLLIEGHDRMFLVPEVWSPSDSTLVLPLDGSVRIQFQFRNETP